MLDKISLSIFSSLEILLAAIYLAGVIRILKATRTIGAETCERSHLKWLFFACIALITVTVITIVLEYLVSWGVRASLVGLMYSLKLKIELAAFKHLESVAPNSAIIVGVRRTDGPIASMRHSISTRYNSFAFARPRPEKMAKGKQAQPLKTQSGVVSMTSKLGTFPKSRSNQRKLDASALGVCGKN
jgi:hypothetical protein